MVLSATYYVALSHREQQVKNLMEKAFILSIFKTMTAKVCPLSALQIVLLFFIGTNRYYIHWPSANS